MNEIPKEVSRLKSLGDFERLFEMAFGRVPTYIEYPQSAQAMGPKMRELKRILKENSVGLEGSAPSSEEDNEACETAGCRNVVRGRTRFCRECVLARARLCRLRKAVTKALEGDLNALSKGQLVVWLEAFQQDQSNMKDSDNTLVEMLSELSGVTPEQLAQTAPVLEIPTVPAQEVSAQPAAPEPVFEWKLGPAILIVRGVPSGVKFSVEETETGGSVRISW